MADTSVKVAVRRRWAFDAALPPTTPQLNVFDGLVSPLVARFFDGFNATVYTMGSDFKRSNTPDERGILPRVIDAILNEEIYDLLAGPPGSGAGLSVRDEGKRGIVAAGLTEHRVESLAQVAALLNAGALQRATASTNMNAHSSRSHAICTLAMEQYDAVAAGVEARTTSTDAVEAELASWKRVARVREAELRIVTSAKDKWKQVADGLLADRNGGGASSALDTVGGGGVGMSAISLASLKALAQEAMEFETAIRASSSPASRASSSPTESESASSPEQLQAHLDSFSDVLVEKEKILRELTSTTSSSTAREARLAGLTSSYEQKISQLERRVETLALGKERLSLEVQASGTDAATRQRDKDAVLAKLQALERELQAARQARKECAHLTSLWRTGAFKISTLEQEVADMQRQRAELQRTLKDAAGTHRREKREHELQLLQLKRQDQRKQLELQRLTALHATQHSALKRKTEEAAAANKRMRVLAANQQQQKSRASVSAPDGRQPSSSRTEYMDSVAAVLERTLAVQATIVGAKRAIETDLEARSRLALEISTLEARASADSADVLAALKASLRDKSSEIRELQQKLASVERTNALPDELFPSTAASCHQIIRSLIDTAVEGKAVSVALESATSAVCAAEEQLVHERDAYEYAIEGLKSEMRALSRRAGVALDDTFAFYSAPSAAAAPDGAAAVVSSHSVLLQQALNAANAEVKALRAELEAQTATRKKPPAAKKKAVEMEDEIVSSSESDDSDTSDDDSDYVEHDFKKRRRVATSRASVSASATAATPRRASGDVMDEIDDLLATPSRAGVPLCCSCSGKCATKACACKAERLTCGSGCACNASKCHNRDGVERRRQSAVKRKKTTDASATGVDSFIVITDDNGADSGEKASRGGSGRHHEPVAAVATATTESIDLTSPERRR
ncbi:hypothetical protein PybrP1_009449 [[Pythium] brassicae (nom. inval.)]|nr:hypothetical protein PybrP1_009449 [[Pythium] brassicae (nom. inval.)]